MKSNNYSIQMNAKTKARWKSVKIVSGTVIAVAVMFAALWFIYPPPERLLMEATPSPQILLANGQSTPEIVADQLSIIAGGKEMLRLPDASFSGPNTGIAMLNERKITFVLDGNSVGEFWFDDESQLFRFEGDAAVSLAIFIRGAQESETMTEIEYLNHLADSIR
jgi:hypothetical protein